MFSFDHLSTAETMREIRETMISVRSLVPYIKALMIVATLLMLNWWLLSLLMIGG